jgi:O-antigen/teichoic acid export membrane protein
MLKEYRPAAAIEWLFRQPVLWGLADQIVLSFLSFFSMIVVAKAGNASQLGIYAVGNSIIILLLTAQDALVTRPYSIQVFKPAGTPSQHASSSLILSFAVSMIAIVGLVAAAIFLHSGGQAGISLALAIISPFILLREFARRHGLANMNMTQAFIVDAIAAFVGMLALALFYYWGWLTATSAMLSIGAGAGLGGAYWLFRNRSQLAFHRESLRLTFWQSWGLGKWLLTSQLAMQMQGYAIHWLSLLLISAAATGAYAAALSVVALSNPFLFGFFNLLMPKTVRTLKDMGSRELMQQVRRDAVVLGVIMLGFAVLLALAGGWIMALLYPGIFKQGEVSVLKVLYLAAIAGTVGAVGGPAAIALQGMERGKLLAMVSLSVFAAGTLLSWIFIRQFGLLGAGIGLLVTETIGCVARWITFQRVVNGAIV